MLVIHEVQLQKVCGIDNWMTPREGEKHEEKKKKSFHGGCDALGKASQHLDQLPVQALHAERPCLAGQGSFQQDPGPRP